MFRCPVLLQLGRSRPTSSLIEPRDMTDAVFQVGALGLRSNLFLSPLAGDTNLPFRLVIRELGGVGLCTTDLVNARSLLELRSCKFDHSTPGPGAARVDPCANG